MKWTSPARSISGDSRFNMPNAAVKLIFLSFYIFIIFYIIQIFKSMLSLRWACILYHRLCLAPVIYSPPALFYLYLNLRAAKTESEWWLLSLRHLCQLKQFTNQIKTPVYRSINYMRIQKFSFDATRRNSAQRACFVYSIYFYPELSDPCKRLMGMNDVLWITKYFIKFFKTEILFNTSLLVSLLVCHGDTTDSHDKRLSVPKRQQRDIRWLFQKVFFRLLFNLIFIFLLFLYVSLSLSLLLNHLAPFWLTFVKYKCISLAE